MVLLRAVFSRVAKPFAFSSCRSSRSLIFQLRGRRSCSDPQEEKIPRREQSRKPNSCGAFEWRGSGGAGLQLMVARWRSITAMRAFRMLRIEFFHENLTEHELDASEVNLGTNIKAHSTIALEAALNRAAFPSRRSSSVLDGSLDSASSGKCETEAS
jgi:hypothetical protein